MTARTGRRLSVNAAVWIVVLALFSSGTAVAQGDAPDEEEARVETRSYGDSELIAVLSTYGLLDEWTAQSLVSPQASLLLVTGNSSYQAQRQQFLDAIQAWARRTEQVREDVARIDAAQGNADHVRSIVAQVHEALVLDDRLASDSKTLVQIEDALGQLSAMQIPRQEPGPSEDPLTLAEAQLNDLRDRAELEVQALNGVEPAFASAGIEAFVGYEDLKLGLNEVDQLIKRGRDQVAPAREESERLAEIALAQIPNLHAARMFGSSDVGGLNLVTVDAYIRAAERSACSLDWALLAGIGQIESNHGRIGGASVSASGRVSTTILGPLLDGGEEEREREQARLRDEPGRVAVEQAVAVTRRAARATFENSWYGVRRSLSTASETSDNDTVDRASASVEPGDQGNGFAVVVDSDGGRLDGNERWDRAIGPMQFLPETWSKWATDGNGDGVADPHNLYDAAAAAGRFLCDLSATRGPSPSMFVLGYNSSTSYVRNVLAAAQVFRSTSLPAP